MSAGEHEREKVRLQKLVKGFAREAVIGIAVTLVSPETARMTSYCFQMDRYLTAFSLKPTDGTVPHAVAAQVVSVKDLASICKGSEVAARAPRLAALAVACVGVGTRSGGPLLFFHFNESLERDRFYTCLRVLRMSADLGAL